MDAPRPQASYPCGNFSDTSTPMLTNIHENKYNYGMKIDYIYIFIYLIPAIPYQSEELILSEQLVMLYTKEIIIYIIFTKKILYIHIYTNY